MTITQSALGFYVVTPEMWGGNWAWGLPLIVVTVVVHVLGLGFIYQKAVEMFWRKKNRRHPTVVFAVVMSTVILLATVLHAVEAGAWAACYQFLGARPDYKSSMLYSLGAMTTYGHANLSLESPWQLMGAIEALSGWLLFGLTAAFLFATIQKCHESAVRDRRL
jgi:MFS superfamily sulfate permease-like transporter